ncbi:hypothetical protein AQI88_41480 [Streptomyces cellostaticus]|uniref:Uncharacterized protein n=1 Tax=Streptomyces cellostaticus TaxID=67285 RepID=A0A101N3F7_9ACTN|nr:hypothetical protein [Streptomyces cellostaticus]KUM85834.1 hypothetical protein AQI88_41480 [Streptomyces cellostaticus]
MGDAAAAAADAVIEFDATTGVGVCAVVDEVDKTAKDGMIFGSWSDPLGLYGSELEDLGGGWYRSPEGLDYGPGSAEGHRMTHVMQLTRENPAKPAHGVFDKGNQGVLETVDEAWSRRAMAVP